jgi:hypothetical protein
MLWYLSGNLNAKYVALFDGKQGGTDVYNYCLKPVRRYMDFSLKPE